jgi:hypothetical protein
LAPVAAAQEDGVFFDPDSPAGKEYAIPLEQARRDAAAGGSTGRGSEGGGQSLFGAGIEPAEGGREGSRSQESGPDAGATPATDDRPRDGGASKEENGSRAKNGNGSSGRQDVVDDRARAPTLESTTGRSEAVSTAGVAVGVLAVGLLVGFALRRLLRGP